jgi:hypothetical protein
MALQQLNHKRTSPPRPPGQESRPASYLLLLSATDQGWRIVDVEMALAKDRSGLIYIITMQHPAASVHRELILPRTLLTEKLLADMRTDD